MKDLWEASYILGKRIQQHRKNRFSIENSNKRELHVHSTMKLSKTQTPCTDEEIVDMSQVLYASTVESIMYAITCTHPDVSYALIMVSRC